MIILANDGSLFGPYDRVKPMDDRIRTWPVGAALDALGADLPFAVIGVPKILDIETPPGFCADAFEWNGVDLVLKVQPASISVDEAGE